MLNVLLGLGFGYLLGNEQARNKLQSSLGSALSNGLSKFSKKEVRYDSSNNETPQISQHVNLPSTEVSAPLRQPTEVQ